MRRLNRFEYVNGTAGDEIRCSHDDTPVKASAYLNKAGVPKQQIPSDFILLDQMKQADHHLGGIDWIEDVLRLVMAA